MQDEPLKDEARLAFQRLNNGKVHYQSTKYKTFATRGNFLPCVGKGFDEPHPERSESYGVIMPCFGFSVGREKKLQNKVSS